MIKLYQFSISHFCEKARWALDYKGLAYQPVNLLPGPHVSTIKKMAKKSCLPVLVDEGKVVQESANIISYLDEKVQERPLTPVNPEQKTAALEWEKYLNQELGVHVRRYCYHWVLQDPAIAVPLLADQGPWYGRIMLRLIFKKLVKVMRKAMNVNVESAEESRRHIVAAIDRLHAQLSKQPFLVGDSFTRADLTAAALLAPLCQPAKFGGPTSKTIPEAIAKLRDEIAGRTAWVDRFYNDYR